MVAEDGADGGFTPSAKHTRSMYMDTTPIHALTRPYTHLRVFRTKPTMPVKERSRSNWCHSLSSRTSNIGRLVGTTCSSRQHSTQPGVGGAVSQGPHPRPTERSQTGHAPVHLDQHYRHVSSLLWHTRGQVVNGVSQLGALGEAWWGSVGVRVMV